MRCALPAPERCRSSCRSRARTRPGGRGFRGGSDGEGDRLAAVLLALVQDDRLGEGGRPARLERELVRPWIDRQRAAVEPLGHDLPIDGHFDRRKVAPGAVLDRQDDRGRCGVHLVDAPVALLAHLGWAARGGAYEQLGPREPQLVLRAELERGLRRHQAVADRGVRGPRGTRREREPSQHRDDESGSQRAWEGHSSQGSREGRSVRHKRRRDAISARSTQA